MTAPGVECPPWRQRQGRHSTPGEVVVHLSIQVVVVEQVVELDEHRIGLVGQFGDAGKHIFGRVAVDEHGVRSFARLPLWRSDAFYHPRLTRLPMIPGLTPFISQCQLVLSVIIFAGMMGLWYLTDGRPDRS